MKQDFREGDVVLVKTMKLGTRVVLSKEGLEFFRFGKRDPNRVGTIIENAPGIREDNSIISVLWDGRKSVEELSIRFVQAHD